MCLLADNVDAFAAKRFGIEVENFRTIASSQILYGIVFASETVGGACDACRLLADGGELMGEPQPTRTAIIARATTSDRPA